MFQSQRTIRYIKKTMQKFGERPTVNCMINRTEIGTGTKKDWLLYFDNISQLDLSLGNRVGAKGFMESALQTSAGHNTFSGMYSSVAPYGVFVDVAVAGIGLMATALTTGFNPLAIVSLPFTIFSLGNVCFVYFLSQIIYRMDTDLPSSCLLSRKMFKKTI